MQRRWIQLLICWLAAGQLFACAVEQSAQQPDKVVLGLIAPFERNRPAVDGAVLAADEINAAGGIRIGGETRKIELVVEDNQGEPEAAVARALKLINRDGAVALIGVPRSFNAIPVGRIAEAHGIPLISTMSTHPETTAGKRFVFRLAFLDAFQGKALADFAYGDLGVRRAAILRDAVGPYNAYLSEVFSQTFRDHGGQVTAHETFTEDDLEIAEQLQRINDSGAELLFVPNASDLVKLHILAARQSGFAGTFLGGDTWSHGIDPVEHPEFHGAYFSDLWAPDQADREIADFIEAYRQAFETAPTASAALSYDAVSMIARALASGSAPLPGEGQARTDSDAIRIGLAATSSFHGVSGTIGFHGSGDPARSVFIRRFDDDGQIRLHKEINP